MLQTKKFYRLCLNLHDRHYGGPGEMTITILSDGERSEKHSTSSLQIADKRQMKSVENCMLNLCEKYYSICKKLLKILCMS